MHIPYFSNQTSKPFISSPNELFEHYLDLRKIRRKKVEALDHEKKAILHSRLLYIEVKLQSAKAVNQLYDPKADLQTWTQWKERIIQLREDQISREAEIKEKSKEIRIKSAHIENIDKALLSLEKDMWTQIDPRNKRCKSTLVRVAHSMENIGALSNFTGNHIKSSSQTSLETIMTSASQYSMSIGGTVLKKLLRYTSSSFT